MVAPGEGSAGKRRLKLLDVGFGYSRDVVPRFLVAEVEQAAKGLPVLCLRAFGFAGLLGHEHANRLLDGDGHVRGGLTMLRGVERSFDLVFESLRTRSRPRLRRLAPEFTVLAPP
jgi:hypothetical protein